MVFLQRWEDDLLPQRKQQPLVSLRDKTEFVTDNWDHVVTLEKQTGHRFCQRLSSHLWIFPWILASRLNQTETFEVRGTKLGSWKDRKLHRAVFLCKRYEPPANQRCVRGPVAARVESTCLSIWWFCADSTNCAVNPLLTIWLHPSLLTVWKPLAPNQTPQRIGDYPDTKRESGQWTRGEVSAEQLLILQLLFVPLRISELGLPPQHCDVSLLLTLLLPLLFASCGLALSSTSVTWTCPMSVVSSSLSFTPSSSFCCLLDR